MKTLYDYTLEEQCEMNYLTELLPLRRAEYAKRMETVTVPTEIAAWARRMEYAQANNGAYEAYCERNKIMPDAAEKAEWCKTLGVWYNRLPLITAFMVIRWGEEPNKWPDQFTAEDIQRAQTWFTRQTTPPGVMQAEKAGV